MSLIYYVEPGYWRDEYAQNLTVDDPFDIEQTIISQYGATSTIAQLCRNMDTYIDPATDFNTFYDYVWNVDTAQRPPRGATRLRAGLASGRRNLTRDLLP